MPAEICFYAPDGNRICVPLYYDPIRFYDPNPPDPVGPWLKALGIGDEIVREISVVSAVAAIAERASGSEVTNALQTTLRQEAERLQEQLPKATEFHVTG